MSNVQVVKKAVNDTKVVSVQSFMENQRDLIAKVLPKTITPERMLGIFTMILKSSPMLSKCSQSSLIGAVIQTAQLGLQPGNMGHIHLIPFNNKGVMEVQLVIGYKGFIELVNRSGKASILNAEVVYGNDFFEFEQGLNPVLRHIPKDGDRGEKVGVYCIAKNLLANEKVFVYIQKDEVEKVKKSSRSGESDYSPWKNWPEEMWKKTAVKRISKLLPLSAEDQKAISADETIKTKIDPEMTSIPDETNWDLDQSGESAPPAAGEAGPGPAPAQTDAPPAPNGEGQDKPRTTNPITDAQNGRLYGIAKQTGYTNEEIHAHLAWQFNLKSTKDVSKEQYAEVVKYFEPPKKS